MNLTEIKHQSAVLNGSDILNNSTDYVSTTWNTVVQSPTRLLGTVGVSLIAPLGVVMNILSIVVLLQPKMRVTSINILLTGLQIADLLVVFGILCLASPTGILLKAYAPQMLPYLTTVSTIGLIGSYYFLIFISMERYIVVCHPLKVKILCSPRRSVIVSIGVAVFCVLYSLPLNEVEIGVTKEIWEFGLFFVIAIPLLALLFFNTAICIGYREAQKAVRCLGTSQDKGEDNSLTLISMLIVLVFLFCNSFYVMYYIFTLMDLTLNWFMAVIVIPLAPLFLTVNSACNFIFYCAFGTKFRMELKKLLGCNSRLTTNNNQLT